MELPLSRKALIRFIKKWTRPRKFVDKIKLYQTYETQSNFSGQVLMFIAKHDTSLEELLKFGEWVGGDRRALQSYAGEHVSIHAPA